VSYSRPVAGSRFDSGTLGGELRGLTRAEVRFVLIGGLALGSWGVIRGTKDCDIVPEPPSARVCVAPAREGAHAAVGLAMPD